MTSTREQARARYKKNPEPIRARQRIYNASHREEQKAYAAHRRATKPEEIKRSKKEAFLRRAYGITIADYDRMFIEQGGLCWICRRESTRERLCVDHDKNTGVVRGLLCRKCNLGIGHLDHNVENLAAAIEYLMPKLAQLKGA